MTDKVIHVNVTSTKSQRVSVSPGNVQNEITATPDSSQYYSNLAKNWAIGAGLILNEDYSSKHYAKESANSASSAKNYADASQTTYTNVQNVANEALTDIEDARVNAIGDITTIRDESIVNIEAKANEASTLVNAGIAEINTTKTNAVNAVTTTKNNAVTEINKEVTDGKKELNDIIEAGGLNINDKITNCLLEVPQKIKLELNNGTLTLKAGSKVIVPNGAGVFDEITAISDATTMGTLGLGEYMIFDNGTVSGQSLRQCLVNNVFSGSTAPTEFDTGAVWYNNTDNIVRTYQNDDWIGSRSFPIAKVTVTTDGIHIDQVFNGMGYIGHSWWLDKGVKYLISNGYNDDGTIKNIEAITEKVQTISMEATRRIGVLRHNGTIEDINGNNYFISTTQPNYHGTTSSLWYNPETLEWKRYFSSLGTWEVHPSLPIIWHNNDVATGQIIEFVIIRKPVHLLTYDDIKINNPYFFGQYIWSEFAPDNLSWLKSSGQWNSGSGYQSFYDWALANANANKAGFKLSTASYTDYDIVVNPSNKTFRLAIKVQNTPVALSDTVPVSGNGNCLGLTDGTNVFSLIKTNDVGLYQSANNILGQSVGTSAGGGTAVTNKAIGVVTDPTKSGLVANLSANTNVSLYFYVGETVKDPTLINMAQIASNFADKIGRTECKAYITETYRSGTSWYRIWSDGWIEQGGRVNINKTNSSYTGTVTLLKPFVDVNYNCTFGFGGSGDASCFLNSLTTMGFTVYQTGDGNNTVNQLDWKACGY